MRRENNTMPEKSDPLQSKEGEKERAKLLSENSFPIPL